MCAQIVNPAAPETLWFPSLPFQSHPEANGRAKKKLTQVQFVSSSVLKDFFHPVLFLHLASPGTYSGHPEMPKKVHLTLPKHTLIFVNSPESSAFSASPDHVATAATA